MNQGEIGMKSLWQAFWRLNIWVKLAIVVIVVGFLNWVSGDPSGAGETIRQEWWPPAKEVFWNITDFFVELAKALSDWVRKESPK